MKKVYIVSTNGGNELLVNADGRWFSTNCAPDGMFGDVDIDADEPLSVIAFKLEQQIDEIGGGRVWSGSRAKKIGLVDELGTLQDAIAYAGKLAKISDYSVSAYPMKKTKFELLFDDIDQDEISAKILKSKLGADRYKLFEMVADPKSQNTVMMELPYRVSF